MEFEYGQTVTRDRRKLIPDPYNPERMIPGPWSDVDSSDIEQAFIASSSSTPVSSATRTQTLTEKSLYCQPDADVRAGDRIRAGGEVYFVHAKPAGDVNPFTGWQPVVEIPLENAEG